MPHTKTSPPKSQINWVLWVLLSECFYANVNFFFGCWTAFRSLAKWCLIWPADGTDPWWNQLFLAEARLFIKLIEFESAAFIA